MPRLLTVPETAEYMRVSVSTIRNYIHDGRLPVVRYSGGSARRLIPVDAIDALIAAHTHRAAP